MDGTRAGEGVKGGLGSPKFFFKKETTLFLGNLYVCSHSTHILLQFRSYEKSTSYLLFSLSVSPFFMVDKLLLESI